MIAFATLWLGLVAGTLPLQLDAGPGVASIELVLDGAPVETLRAPPWATTIDLGSELQPHRLEAIGLDAGGHRVGVAEQWLGMPRPPGELEVTLGAGAGGHTVAHLAWASLGGAEPSRLAVTLDGVALPLAAGVRELELPPVAPGTARLLRVEAEFPGGVRASRELALGGEMAEEVSTDLTAVPVEVAGASATPLALREGDTKLPVVALEEGAAELVVVLDPGCRDILDKIERQAARHRMGTVGSSRAGTMSTVEIDRAGVPLPKETRMRMVWPVAQERTGGEMRFDLFPTSPPRGPADGTLLALLAQAGVLPSPAQSTRVTDAVAVAALLAAEEGKRRSVVVVLGPDAPDDSLYSAPAVRRYLARLRVPLLVWSVVPPGPAMHAGWGEVEDVSTLARFEAAARRLDVALGRQRIAWVAGRHLPQRIEAPADGSLRLATEVPITLAPPLPPAADGDAADEGATSSTARVAAPASTSSAADDLPPDVPVGFAMQELAPFTLATDVRDARLVQTLARIAAALPADYGTRFGLQPRAGGTVILFAREQAFRSWLVDQGGGDLGVEGFARNGTAALALGDGKEQEVAGLLVHELTHLLSHSTGAALLPPWLDEGMSEELAICRRAADGHTVAGTLRLERSAQRTDSSAGGKPTFEVTLAGPGASLVALLSSPRPPLAELVAMSHDAFVAPIGRERRYAHAAFFVRFLLEGEDGRWRAGFQRYMATATGGGASDAASLEAALGTPLRALQPAFDIWLRHTAEILGRAPA